MDSVFETLSGWQVVAMFCLFVVWDGIKRLTADRTNPELEKAQAELRELSLFAESVSAKADEALSLKDSATRELRDEIRKELRAATDKAFSAQSRANTPRFRKLTGSSDA